MTPGICLALILYFEARSEPLDGQLAVADVVISRVESTRWPNSICSVMVQNKQFSFYEGKLEIKDIKTFKRMKVIAKHIMQGYRPQIVNADHYHTSDVQPGWSRHMKLVRVIGKHKFYKSGYSVQW